MQRDEAAALFSSLGSGIRLDIFRLLVRAGTEGMVAGDIATTLALPANNLSFHLKGLTRAGLASVTQEGRYQRYRANLALMNALLDYLTAECCAGQPELCLQPPAETTTGSPA